MQQRFFDKPPLQPHQELEVINFEIEDLKRLELEYFKILQNAASIPRRIPEKDWSKYPFYSPTLSSWNFKYPPDHMGFYLTTLTAIGVVSKALWKSWNMKKASEILKNGKNSVEFGKFDFHMYNSGFSNEADLPRSRGFMIGRAIAVGGMLICAFSGLVRIKNVNR